MKSFAENIYLKNKKSLDYLISNPFKEPLSYTFLKLFGKNKCFIVNKNETVSPDINTFIFKVKKRNKVVDIIVNVFRDQSHSINITVLVQNKKISKTTNDVEEAVSFVENFIC